MNRINKTRNLTVKLIFVTTCVQHFAIVLLNFKKNEIAFYPSHFSSYLFLLFFLFVLMTIVVQNSILT